MLAVGISSARRESSNSQKPADAPTGRSVIIGMMPTETVGSDMTASKRLELAGLGSGRAEPGSQGLLFEHDHESFVTSVEHPLPLHAGSHGLIKVVGGCLQKLNPEGEHRGRVVSGLEESWYDVVP
jgi:hypothetical protein